MRRFSIMSETAAAEPSAEIEELHEVNQALRAEIDALKAENKQLLIAPAHLCTEETDEKQVDDVLDSQEDSLKAELLAAKTDLARLQFANTKLHDRVVQMERMPGKQRSIGSSPLTRRRKLNGDLTEQEKEQQALQEQVKQLRQKLSDLTKERTTVESAHLEKVGSLEAELRELKETHGTLKRDHDYHMQNEGLTELATAKVTLQQINSGLIDEVDGLKEQLAAAKADIKTAKTESEVLRVEGKKTMERLINLEKALTKKLPQNGKNSSIDSRLQEEIGILIHENLEMREQMEALEEKVRMLEQCKDVPGLDARASPRSLGSESQSSSTNEMIPVAQSEFRGMIKVFPGHLLIFTNTLLSLKKRTFKLSYNNL